MAWVSAHQLALDWSAAALRRSSGPSGPPSALSSGPPSGPPSGPSGPSSGPASGPPARRPVIVAGASHDAKLAVHRFVRMCVEVLNGHRPPAHLRRLAVPADASAVVAQGLIGARRVAQLRRAAQGPGRRPGRRPAPVAVIQLRMCEPRPGAVEAAVALVTGERTWAMALRLELHQQSWCATILRLI
ncbi:Rv3235 family protein [Actinoplanes sp. NPDC051513]|uniref:Rv3235 family protein n=1 Tax=Actinoplanes sp. NPDC051513 TaxID=3363908 RepID=UPI00378BD33F